MNMKDQIRVLKAAKKCDLRVYQSRTTNGSRCVRLLYNKFGDSILFDPLLDIGQAMDMLIHLGGTLVINNKEKSCAAYITTEKNSKASVVGSWRSNGKNKKKNICNAIINCILRLDE